ncbi:MAG: 4Fe-4S dicluster domain-containing protein [Xanthomonadaceae bacterium]|nr:4Fe-4S dicluster domain-containing protein [Xanthomonadaceae bacterium]MDE1958376.1 4Fe-4S dicluster domain-containing protein [Xanthomonadaceae bacterium]MDE2178104.1 4Fe-4S dicluster domain-containing protein [Xanthomonadaceae bacterium]MDE2246125.1 4Fe-4S dicluster domain-containing protein [Xanthomonadaceae bacterium]
MPIHEKSLIRKENLIRNEKLALEGVDVSGDWSTFIGTRVITDYNEALEGEIAALPGGEHIHRCWQCGSCTNSCTVNAINPEFNPRYWIYLIRLGLEEELLRDKDIIWQCVSCNKCTYACPRDVVPEGVMKATAHWLELKGHTRPSSSTIFDEEFSGQVFAKGKIEEGRLMRKFFARTGQKLAQPWLVAIIRGLVARMPAGLLTRLGLAALIHPRTRDWGRTRDAINEYVIDQHARQRRALGLAVTPTERHG